MKTQHETMAIAAQVLAVQSLAHELVDHLCERLDRIAEELIEIRKETAEMHRQLAHIAQSMPLQLLTLALETEPPYEEYHGEDDAALIPEDLAPL